MSFESVLFYLNNALELFPLFYVPIILSTILTWIMYPPWSFGNNVTKQALEHYSVNEEKPIIHVRFVTRGTNPQTIIESCSDMDRTLQDSKLASRAQWKLEVVTDMYMDLQDYAPHVNQIVVPDDYETPNDTKFKARALNYASHTIEMVNKAWVLHLDEESYFDVHNGHLIVDYCIQENYNIYVKNMMPSFANGAIIYTKQERPENWFISLADCIRVGDDFARFRLGGQCLNTPIFGVHGSFLIIHSDIVKDIGFDVGLMNSITEDYALSLVASSKGYRLGYIEAFVEEQSPFTIVDFLKQRNRWIKGIVLNAIYTPDLTCFLRIAVWYSALCFFLLPMTFLKLLVNVREMLYLSIADYNSVSDFVYIMRMINIFCLVIIWINYNIGYHRGGFSKYGCVTYTLGAIYFLSMVGVYLSLMLEVGGVMWYWVSCSKSTVEFHVVNKDSKVDKLHLHLKKEDINSLKVSDSEKDYNINDNVIGVDTPLLKNLETTI